MNFQLSPLLKYLSDGDPRQYGRHKLHAVLGDNAEIAAATTT